MRRLSLPSCLLIAGALAAFGASAPAAADPAHGWITADQVFDWERDQSPYGTSRDQSPYGTSRRDGRGYGPGAARDENVASGAVGTFRGRNGANGVDETIVIRPDGSAEVRSRDQPPRYGTFAGGTLTIESRTSRVEPARGGIVIDGAFYNR
jgi:hypothetical protein